jgi:acyl-CoA thioester hydrolase
MSMPKFQYTRILQFYETDAMGIIHHANYILIMEEARLQFLRFLSEFTLETELLKEINYPLVSCHVDYKKPLKFNDEVIVDYKVSIDRAKLVFDYHLTSKKDSLTVALGKTVHVAYDMRKQTAIKLPKSVSEFLENRG